MKIKKILCLTATLVFCLSLAFILSSCGNSPSLEERGYTVKVVYDFNGGIVDEATGRTLYYKPGTPIIRPGDTSEVKEPSLNSYYAIEGWYKALTDENGEIIKGEDGKALLSDTPYDFSSEKATESMTLVAKWKKRPTVTIKVDGRDDDVRPYQLAKKTLADGTVVNVATVNRFSYIEGRKDANGNTIATFYDYYMDEACTEKAVFPLTLQDGENVTIYTKWIDGDVLVVRSVSDMASIPNYKNKTIYLDTDIDYSTTRAIFPQITEFSGKFIGNGHTIKNVTKTLSLRKSDSGFGLFGSVKSGAVIENLNLENINIALSIAWNAEFPIGLLACDISSGAKVINCKISASTITCTTESYASGATISYSKGSKYEGIFGSADENVNFDVTGTVTVEENK